VPVGLPHSQQLQLVVKDGGKPTITDLGRCAFVPLVGGEGYVTEW
jgi:hypothetical protein